MGSDAAETHVGGDFLLAQTSPSALLGVMQAEAKIRFGRQPFNGYSHLIGALAALVAGGFLLAREVETPWLWHAKAFYAFALFAALMSSAVFHLVDGPERVMDRLRKIDHWGIRALTIGTYSPLAFKMLPVSWAVGGLAGLWLIALVESFICAPLQWPSRRSRTAISHILIALLPMLVVPFVWQEHGRLLLWLAAGAAVYLVGGICFLKKIPRGNKVLNFHETWHVCVLIAASIHYALIYSLI